MKRAKVRHEVNRQPTSLCNRVWNIVSLADVHPSRWKNGAGVTRELAAWPSSEEWVWRMSVAEVAANGPFSRFDGVQRWFAVLGGSGVLLAFGSTGNVQNYTLTSSSAPLPFDGEEPVHCALIGSATLDFNLMLRRGVCSGTMRRVNAAFSETTQAEKVIGIYSIDKGSSVTLVGQVLDLPPHTLAWCLCPTGTSLQLNTEHALWMEIYP